MPSNHKINLSPASEPFVCASNNYHIHDAFKIEFMAQLVQNKAKRLSSIFGVRTNHPLAESTLRAEYERGASMQFPCRIIICLTRLQAYGLC